jgi:two-component system sensor histidine kinase RegB
MPINRLQRYSHPQRQVRLATLVRLRWLAIIGQTASVVFVYYGLNFNLPLGPCVAVIAVSAWFNTALAQSFRLPLRLPAHRTAWLLAFDTAQVAALLYFTGGLDNPFAFLLLGPALVSATALPRRMTFFLGLFGCFCATALMLFHQPLPWISGQTLELPQLYLVGEWLSIIVAMGFMGAYAWQLAEESRQLGDALAATELVLAREQHLKELDGLAAAAAHELGTPLSTIAVIAKELELAMPPSSQQAEDVRLLREQAMRCRDILAKLTALPPATEMFETMTLGALLQDVVEPHRHFGIAIDVALPTARGNEPMVARNPAILYGLGNIVENAVDFAHEGVVVSAEWPDDEVMVMIADDGPGFPPEIMARIGEPYVTSRGRLPDGTDTRDEESGLGLGFFIAKTLLERTGARLALENRPAPLQGAVVRIRWRRDDFERRPLISVQQPAAAAE